MSDQPKKASLKKSSLTGAEGNNGSDSPGSAPPPIPSAASRPQVSYETGEHDKFGITKSYSDVGPALDSPNSSGLLRQASSDSAEGTKSVRYKAARTSHDVTAGMDRKGSFGTENKSNDQPEESSHRAHHFSVNALIEKFKIYNIIQEK